MLTETGVCDSSRRVEMEVDVDARDTSKRTTALMKKADSQPVRVMLMGDIRSGVTVVSLWVRTKYSIHE